LVPEERCGETLSLTLEIGRKASLPFQESNRHVSRYSGSSATRRLCIALPTRVLFKKTFIDQVDRPCLNVDIK
jgi:hypothetical protein